MNLQGKEESLSRSQASPGGGWSGRGHDCDPDWLVKAAPHAPPGLSRHGADGSCGSRLCIGRGFLGTEPQPQSRGGLGPGRHQLRVKERLARAVQQAHGRAGPPGWRPAWVRCSLFGGSPTGADALGPGIAPQVVARRLQPWGLCSGLSATQQGQRLPPGPHELPPSPGPPGAHAASTSGLSVGARALLQKPENKPTTETFRSRSTWSPITGGETPRAGQPAHRRPQMLGPRPLPLPAQKPNHNSAATGLVVSDAPSSSGPTTGARGSSRQPGGRPLPALPAPSVSLAAAPPQLGCPLPSPHPQVSAPAGPTPLSPEVLTPLHSKASVPRPLFPPVALAAKPRLPPPSFESILSTPRQGQRETAGPQDLSCGPCA